MNWNEILLLILGFAAATACRGFDMLISNERNCGEPDQIIKFTKKSLEINSKCEIISGSCSFVRPYKTAMMSMKVMDGGMQVYQTTYNLCSNNEKPGMVMSNIAGWGIPPSCPIIESSEFCYNGSKVAVLPVPVQNMLQVFSLVRTAKIRIVIVHDTGKSCFEADSSIVKKEK